jgi:LruC domain-containing protein
MNLLKNILFYVVLYSLIINFSACRDEDEISDSETTAFDYRTIKEYTVHIRTLTISNQAFKSVYIELYTGNPLNEAGILTGLSGDLLIFKGMTNSDGLLSCKISPATTVDSLYVLTKQIGLPTLSALALNSNEIECVIGGNSSASKAPVANQPQKATTALPAVSKTYDDKYYVLGSWNTAGVPNYLYENDLVAQDLLDDINNSLPEKVALTVSHPEYLTGTEDGKIKLIEDAEVWVTFVHEGAGYLNSLLYYTYPTTTPPTSIEQLTDPTVIFPNVSYTGSGGGLMTGNKVQLLYLDPATRNYTNVFPAGITISWMIKSNAWSSNRIGNGKYSLFSDINLNPETDPALRKHVVILKDDVRKLFILGFEDVRRDQGSDNDFNDAIFYSTVNPYTAVDLSDFQPIDNGTDNGGGNNPSPQPDLDNDGVSDLNDEYPNDASKAFNNYYPSAGGTGTLAFEDLFPNRGDYDFNDMVLDYNFNQITNGQNEVVELDIKLTLRAIGASFLNGFGFQFNTTPANIQAITGQLLSEDIIQLLDNGTEANQSKAVVIAFDNAYHLLPHPGQGSSGVNTSPNTVFLEPYEFTLNIKLANPVSVLNFGTPPYNPFIFVDKVRSREIHLPTYSPTDLADKNLFGTGDDDSNPETGTYYMSSRSLPWAINLPVRFDYPSEKEDITATYLNFFEWANSKGERFKDWYINQAGYRQESKVYRP